MKIQQIWSPHEGATLLIPSGPVKHLFVVLTKPCIEKRVAIVNFTKIVEGDYHDPSCVAAAGDHPFLIHPSYVFYEMGRIVSTFTLTQGIASGEFVARTPINPSLFERVCDGAINSDDAPQKFVAYVNAQFAI